MLELLRPRLPYLWYENEQGERWVPEREPGPWLRRILKLLNLYEPIEEPQEPPKGFIYQWSRFPSDVHDTCLRRVLQEEVDACDHRPEYVVKTGGWIDGIKGRECRACHGTQVIKEDEQWPLEWQANGSRTLMSGTTGYPGDLVMAMLRPSAIEVARQIYRYGFRAVGFKDYGQAVMYAAVACERCINALGYRHGLPWGYPCKSDEWHKAGTSCELCDPDHVKLYVDPDEMC